jgi:hypothetical protein
MAVLDRVPVETITAQARQVDVARVVLSLLALIPFLLGWTAGKAFVGLAWVALAVKAGWREARAPRDDGG